MIGYKTALFAAPPWHWACKERPYSKRHSPLERVGSRRVRTKKSASFEVLFYFTGISPEANVIREFEAMPQYLAPCHRLASGRCSTAQMRTHAPAEFPKVRLLFCKSEIKSRAGARFDERTGLHRQKRKAGLVSCFLSVVTRTGIEPMPSP